MPEHFRVGGNGIVAKTGLDHAEDANFEALKRAVLASEARKKEERRQERIAQGLPPEEEEVGLFKRLWGRVSGKKSESEALGEEGVVR